MTTRGIRNNNPGNIDRNTTKWQGMSLDQTSEPRFIVFTDAKYGIRAIAMILLTYTGIYKLRSIKEFISRWAPSSENDVGSYVLSVGQDMKRDVNQPLNVYRQVDMLPLVKAIIHHENGIQPYTDEQVLEGLVLAGVKD